MTTPTPTYPRLPDCAPRCPGETAEAYGLRALAFCVAHDLTATVDTEGLQLADHVFGLAVSGRELVPQAATRLAEVHRQIGATLRGRQLAAEAARDVALAAILGETPGGPQGGQPVPVAPRPTQPTPPSQGVRLAAPQAAPQPVQAATVPALVPPPLPPLPAPQVAPPAVVAVTGPAALPASQTAVSPAAPRAPRFVIKPRPVVQLTGTPTQAPVRAEDWGF